MAQLNLNTPTRLFIYNKREAIVLLILGVLIALFAFTLGVHLGKQVGALQAQSELALHPKEAALIETTQDSIPDSVEILKQSKGVQEAADQVAKQTLEEEVKESGIQLEKARQLEMPTEPKGQGAVSLDEMRGKAISAKSQSKSEHSGEHKPQATLNQQELREKFGTASVAGEALFTLQVGSFPTAGEAKDLAESLQAVQLKPMVREAQIRGKTWYRVYAGGFSSAAQAEKEGLQWVAQKAIEGFVVVPAGRIR